MVPTSPEFDDIKDMIDPDTPTAFKVHGYRMPDVNGASDNIERTLCPHVLGWKRNGIPNMTIANERVLCWQLSPGTPWWRCFEPRRFVQIEEVANPVWTTDPTYSRHQSSVQNDQYHMPYPD